MRSKRFMQRQAATAKTTSESLRASETKTSRSVHSSRMSLVSTTALAAACAEAPAELPISAPSGTARKKKATLPWFFAVVLFMAVAAAFIFRQAEVMSVQKNLTAVQQEIEHYKALNESLQAQLAALQSDEYIEKAAREKLGLVMPGEIQYMVVDYSAKN